MQPQGMPSAAAPGPTPLLHIAHLYFVPVFATAWSVHEKSEIGASLQVRNGALLDRRWYRVHPAAGGQGRFEAFRSHDVDVADSAGESA
jgi:hypothetical protein